MDYLFEPVPDLPPLEVFEWPSADAVEAFKIINAHWLGSGLQLKEKE